ncbi:hypothetical protein [Cohnella sp.]
MRSAQPLGGLRVIYARPTSLTDRIVQQGVCERTVIRASAAMTKAQ